MTYKVSKDYKRLKQLLDQGDKVVCFVDFDWDRKGNDEGHKCRKPNTGMLDVLYRDVQRHLFRSEHITKKDCLMIGDASDKDGQWSDTDKKTAENFGCDYLDVEDFVKLVNLGFFEQTDKE